MGGTSPCPIADDLERFLLGQLSEAEADPLEQHVTACPACLARLESLRPRDGLLDALAGVRAAPTPPVPVDDALVASLCRLRRLGGVPAAGGRGDTPLPEESGDAPAADDPGRLLSPPQGPGEIGRLGPYRVLRLLGSGGMGVVWQAWQDHPRRLVALKMIGGAARTSRVQLSRFRRETEIAAGLQHPNIVPIYEAGEHDGQPYFTMEFLGGSLAQNLAAPPPPGRAAELVRTLARAVQFAHDRGFVHRDLKPSNVLLTADGTPKISDFGLAKQWADLADAPPGTATESGAVLGTPGYMAPEQASGRGADVGPAADTYALGAILYECLTGRPPFRAATVLQTLELARTREPVPPGRLHPGLARDLETISLKCLEKDPRKRYGSAGELADDLGRFLAGEPIRARRASWAERLTRWVRRRPALVALLAACALLLAALVAGSLEYQARLRAAVERAETEKAEAQKQEKLAARRYHAAHGTLDRILRNEALFRTADAAALQELMEANLSFYQELQGADDLDPVLRQDTASVLSRCGQILLSKGQNARAEELFRQAVAILEALPPTRQSQPAWLDSLAEAYTYLGVVVGDAGRHEEQERAYRQALALRERQVEADPQEWMWQDGLARIEVLLVNLCVASGRWAEAEAHGARALAVYDRLTAAHPENESIRAAQASAFLQIGSLYQKKQRLEEAGAAYARGEGLLVPLAARHPEGVQYALSLAAVCVNRADVLREVSQHEAARQCAHRAVDLTEALLRKDLRSPAFRALAFEAHRKHARACEALGRWADAAADWGRVVELDAAPNPAVRRTRALALVRAGEYCRAAAEAQALLEGPALPADEQYSLAGLYTLAAGAARSDSRLGSAERARQAEQYAGRAVAILWRLMAAGYFQTPANANRLRTDTDLRELRHRADFRLLTAVGL